MTTKSDASREQLEDAADDFFAEYLELLPTDKQHKALIGLLEHVRDQARKDIFTFIKDLSEQRAAALGSYIDVSAWALIRAARKHFSIDEKEDDQGPT